MLAALGCGATSGCKNTGGEAVTVGPAEPARRAATSFVHCVEQEGGGCVRRDPKQGSWDAFALLTWLGSGSPTSILQALRRELEHHRDPLAVQDRFVDTTARYREPLRGAECRPESAQPVAEVLPKLVSRVHGRMEGLGLWREDLEAVVTGLASEAESGLEDGWLVHMTCISDPYELWVATARQDERQVVVGFMSRLPPWIGGTALSEERIEERIDSRVFEGTTSLGAVREGTVDSSWMPFPIEEF